MKTIAPGQCFTRHDPRVGVTHYYMQRETDVLHLGENLVNLLPAEFLASEYPTCRKITPNEFELAARQVLASLDISAYVGA